MAALSGMNILFLNHNVAWRGGFFRAYHWGRHLVARGHSVTLMTISESKRWGFETQIRDGLRLVKSPDLLKGKFRSGWDPWDTGARTARMLHCHYDIIHSVDTRPVSIVPALIGRHVMGGRLVEDWGDWWGHGGTSTERGGGVLERCFEPIETFFEEAFRKAADGTVVLTSALGRRVAALGVDPTTIVHIPHGADTQGIVPRDSATARVRLGLPSDGLIVGYVGTILFPRDRQLLIDACEIAWHQLPYMQLALIGRCGMEPAHFGGHADRVLATGPITYDALQDHVAACNVMLLPLTDTVANRGRWPSKVNDYLAAGRPVVASNVGDLHTLYEPDPIGALTAATPEAFADGMVGTLSMHRDELAELGARARKVAESRLSWDILTSRLEQLYLQTVH